MISSCRDFIQIHVRAHEASRACLFCRMEGYKIDVLHELLGHIDRVVVSTAIGGAVAGKMLYANHDTVGTELCALKSANLCAGHRGTEVGILAGPLNDPAPASIACDVDHGSKGPLNSGGTGVLRGYMLGLLFNRGIPGRCHRERNREDGAISMNHIESEDDGDVQARLVDGDMLQPVDLLDIHLPEDR